MANYITTSGNVSGLQLISTTTSGPSLSVANSNLVSNLNAQLLNTNTSDFYTNATNINAGLLKVGFGGTGVSSFTTGNILFGSGSSLGQSPNLFWNSTSNFLGVNTSTPSNAIDVVGNIRASSSITTSNQFISTVGQTSPPFVVTSSSLVSNLNAQQLNGFTSDYYRNASNINAGPLSSMYGGTGLASLSAGFIPFGSGGSNPYGNSSNLFWNSTSNYLGIGTSNPISPLYVAAISNTTPDTSGISIFSSNINASPIVSLRQSNSSSSNSSLGYISFDWLNVAGFSFGMNPNSSIVGSNVTLDIKNGWNFTGASMMQFNFGTGFVGLRTSSPAALLDINASSNIALILRGASTQQYIYPTSNGAKSEIGFCSQSNTTTNMWLMGQATGATPVSNTFSLYSSTTGSNVWTALSNGYVGIGTSNPQTGVDVANGGLSIRGSNYNSIQIFSTINSEISCFLPNSTTNKWAFGQGSWTSVSNFGLGNDNKSNILTALYSNGFIGIGTTTPANALDVVGNIRASSSITTSNQFISTVANNPPFVVTSSNLVSNLNAQQLNGLNSDYYRNATNINAGTLNVLYGGTGVNTITTGYVNFGSSTGTLGQSSNLFWNSTSNFLGIGTSNPISPLYVAAVSNSNPDSNGISVFSSISNASPIVSLRQFSSNSSNSSLGYISFDWFTVAGFSFGMNPNSSTIGSNVTLDIKNSWNFTGTSMMQFNFGTGFVGLRTPTPAALLDINASSNIALILRGTSTQQYIYPISNGAKSEIGFCSQSNATTNMWIMGQATGATAVSNTFGLYSSTTGSNVWTALSNGYVGIGTSNPVYTLDVTGSIRASSTIISTVATSTAPFTIASSTVVPNLNAQQLNSNTSDFYTNATNITAGLLKVGFGGTGVNVMTTGYVHFGTSAGILGQSSNLFWNSTSNYLGIGTSNPANGLDIANGGLSIRGSNFNSIQIFSTINSEISCFLPNSTTNKWGFGQGSWTSVSNFGLGNDNKSNVLTALYSNGFIGIGTSNPVSMLDINAGANTSFSLRGQSTQQFIYPLSNGSRSEIGFCSQTTNASNLWWMGQATGGGVSNTFGLNSSTYGSNIWSALSNGYFGISTFNPVGYFDVVTPTSSAVNAYIRGGQYRQLIVCPGSTISNATNQACEIIFNQVSDYTTLTSIGSIGINTQNCGISNLGLCSPGRGLAMTIQSNNGYIGIGTSTPSVALNVVGQGLFTDVVKQKRYFYRLTTWTNTVLSNQNNLMGFSNLVEGINISSANFNSNMSIFTPPVAGLWTFTMGFWMGTGSNIGAFEFYILKNSSNLSNVTSSAYVATAGMFYQPSNISFIPISATGTSSLTTSDYVSECIWNQSTTSCNISTDTNTTTRTFIQGTLVQPA